MRAFSDVLKKMNKQVDCIETGLCEGCGRKYEVYMVDGSEVKLGCDCNMIAKAKQQQENYKRRIKREQSNKVFNRSLVNKRLQKARLDNYVPETYNLAKAHKASIKYVSDFNPDNPFSLYFFGSYGTGKSHLAYGIAHDLKEEGYTVLFMNVAQLMSLIRSSYDRTSEYNELEIKELINDVDLMVFDDIGVSESNHSLETLFEIIEMRLGKHNIYTTNLTADEMSRDKKWQRIFSRIIGESHMFDMNGEDYRMRGVKQNERNA